MSATPQSNCTLEQMAGLVAGLDDFVVCGHVSPDGDCVGSTLALVHALRAVGKRACGLKVDPLPASFTFLPGADELVLPADFEGECGCFFAVDVPNRERLGKVAAALHDAAPVTMRIDHHEYHERVSDWSYTDPVAVSASTLVWEFAGYLGAQTPEVAECCYAGLVTDSGRFEFQNTDARAFRLAAEMIACGVNPAKVSAELYESDSYAALALEQRAFERLEVDEDLGWAVTYITKTDFEQLQAAKSDAEGIVNNLRRLKSVKVLCCLREIEDGIRLSFRSKSDINVRFVAMGFGGGGHDAASGATVHTSLDDARLLVKSALIDACLQARAR